MKRIDKSKFIKLDELTCKVQNDPAFENLHGHGMYVEILQSIKGQLDAILSHCEEVRVYRFDLRAAKDTCLPSNNRTASTFIKRLAAKIHRIKKDTQLRYVWVREQTTNNTNQHYHFVLCLDAKLYLTRKHLKALVTSLEQSLGVSVRWSKAHDKQVNTGLPAFKKLRAINTSANKKAYLEEIFRLSYLAKVRTKDNYLRGDKTNDYHSSKANVKTDSGWRPYVDEKQTLTAKLFDTINNY
ncbi:MAG TPA: hypothetical protein DG048_05775 [Pseudoalteromonas sp.]|nr:hypothetical protein [Pseudoalteromonas sp.]|tara:strand:+ start:4894 stop:5616 length:723 start_codon:yes stop_codon:yes gene_type:complete